MKIQNAINANNMYKINYIPFLFFFFLGRYQLRKKTGIRIEPAALHF